MTQSLLDARYVYFEAINAAASLPRVPERAVKLREAWESLREVRALEEEEDSILPFRKP